MAENRNVSEGVLGAVETVVRSRARGSGGCRPGHVAKVTGLSAGDAKAALQKLERQRRIEKFRDALVGQDYYRPASR